MERKKKKKKKNNNAKFSGHYVYPRTETVRAHALRSHQLIICCAVELRKVDNVEEENDPVEHNVVNEMQKLKFLHTLFFNPVQI